LGQRYRDFTSSKSFQSLVVLRFPKTTKGIKKFLSNEHPKSPFPVGFFQSPLSPPRQSRDPSTNENIDGFFKEK
jgi:hypothetical protein